MTEKKATKKTATKKAVATKTTTTTKRAAAKKVEVEVAISAENAGFRAGDVYQALAAAENALSLEEIAKMANISIEDTILGIGWLFKEGKIKSEDNKVALA